MKSFILELVKQSDSTEQEQKFQNLVVTGIDQNYSKFNDSHSMMNVFSDHSIFSERSLHYKIRTKNFASLQVKKAKLLSQI